MDYGSRFKKREEMYVYHNS